MTNPTPEQIEAAAEALFKAWRSPEYFSWEQVVEGRNVNPDPTYPHIVDKFRSQACAALVAAAGVAPQAPRQGIAKVVPTGEGVSCQHGLCPKWCSHLMWACERCSSEGGWGGRREWLDAIVARHRCTPERTPVQVDEAKLSRLIERHSCATLATEGRRIDQETICAEGGWAFSVRADRTSPDQESRRKFDHVARVVAEWMRGGGQ